MKKLFSFLLVAALLLSLPFSAVADTPDEENSGNTESNNSSKIIVVPSESDLPEGYEVDPDYSYTFTIDAESGWTYTIEDLIDDDDSGEYIYFIVEEDIAEGYTPEYYSKESGENSPRISRAARSTEEEQETQQSNVVVVKNIKEGDSPVYELPATGGIGTVPFTVAGVAILIIAAVYGMILLRKRKKNA